MVLLLFNIFVNGILPLPKLMFDLFLDIPEILSLRAAPPQTYTGSYSMITCTAIGTPRPRYRYYSENGTLLTDTVAIVHPVTLRYEDYPRYRAKFRCVPYNIMGEGTAQNVTVEILGK